MGHIRGDFEKMQIWFTCINLRLFVTHVIQIDTTENLDCLPSSWHFPEKMWLFLYQTH